MTPATLLSAARADGVDLTLTAAGAIKAAGRQAAVARWLPEIRQHKPELLRLLAANDTEAAPARRWWVALPDGRTLEVDILPPATRAEVLATYPGATVEPATEGDEEPETEAQPLPAPDNPVHCGSCTHFERIDWHPRLGHCARGEPEAPAGLWDTDRRMCAPFTLPTGANP
jgi:post-segregation antitoxin (ccd killing protein)